MGGITDLGALTYKAYNCCISRITRNLIENSTGRTCDVGSDSDDWMRNWSRIWPAEDGRNSLTHPDKASDNARDWMKLEVLAGHY